MNIVNLFDYVKDHVKHFGFFPCEYEEIKTGKIIEYPDYMYLFNKEQRQELLKIFDNWKEGE